MPAGAGNLKTGIETGFKTCFQLKYFASMHKTRFKIEFLSNQYLILIKTGIKPGLNPYFQYIIWNFGPKTEFEIECNGNKAKF